MRILSVADCHYHLSFINFYIQIVLVYSWLGSQHYFIAKKVSRKLRSNPFKTLCVRVIQVQKYERIRILKRFFLSVIKIWGIGCFSIDNMSTLQPFTLQLN